MLSTCVSGASCHSNGLVAQLMFLLSSLAGSAHLAHLRSVCVRLHEDAHTCQVRAGSIPFVCTLLQFVGVLVDGTAKPKCVCV